MKPLALGGFALLLCIVAGCNAPVPFPCTNPALDRYTLTLEIEDAEGDPFDEVQVSTDGRECPGGPSTFVCDLTGSREGQPIEVTVDGESVDVPDPVWWREGFCPATYTATVELVPEAM